MEEKIPCQMNHEWGGIVPLIDSQKMYVQHPELIGNPCDCKKLLHFEEECGCQNNKHWEAKPKENTNQ